ncbi:MAG: hypothetical protein AAF587_30665 [Bacteroidota bacterium]
MSITHSFLPLSGLLLAFYLMAIPSVEAQQADYLSFVSEEGIHLRWNGSDILPLDGYHVYRRSPGKNWEKLTDEPLTRHLKRRQIEQQLGYQAELFFALFGLEKPQDITETMYRDLRNDPDAFEWFQLMTTLQPAFGELLGEIFLDNTVQDGQRYRYRITVLANGQEQDLLSTGTLRAGQIDEVPVVDGFQGESKDEHIRLMWPRREELQKAGEVISYHVYRSEQGALGPFERINAYNMLPIQISFGDNSSSDQQDQFMDKYLISGTSYHYYVQAVNAFGIESAPSITVAIRAGEDVRPASALSLEAEAYGEGLRLSWETTDPSVEAAQVYKREGERGGFEMTYLPVSAGKGSWLDVAAQAGKHYYYFVEQVNASGLSSLPSDTIHFYLTDEEAPSAPQGLTAESEEGRIILNWQANPEEDVIGYEIERASNRSFSNREMLNDEMLDKTVFVDVLDRESETTYGYVVYAIDASYNVSPPSEMVQARLPDVVPPQSPDVTELIQEGNSVRLSWKANLEEDMGSYRIYRRASGERRGPVGETSALSFVDQPSRKTSYSYAMSAIDQAGNVSELTEWMTIDFEPVKVIPPPSNGQARVEDGMLLLTWDASPDVSVRGYLIGRSSQELEERTDIAQLAPEEKSYLDEFSSSKEATTYSIQAYDAAWNLSEALIITYQPE